MLAAQGLVTTITPGSAPASPEAAARAMSPGLPRSKAEREAERALAGGVNGAQAAMLNKMAPRNVGTEITSRTSTKSVYLVRLS
jgi:hypothetical protein